MKKDNNEGKRCKKQEISGITLIALVVTIIILIILATVSINAVFGEGGLIKRAEISRQLYENSAKNEEEKMKELENTITDTTSKWKYDQKSQSVTNGDITLKVGEYINYNCHLEKEEIYESKVEINGYANQKFSSNTYNDSWRVFGADSNGNLLIISESVISPDEGGYTDATYNTTGFSMHSDSAYPNAITELNNICKVYGKGNNVLGAKCITVDDINKVTGYNPNTANFVNSDLPSCQYNNKVTYTLDSDGISCVGTKYPTVSTKNTKVSTFTYWTGKQWKSLTQGENVEIENTVYAYFPDTLSDKISDEIKGIETTSNACKLLFNSREDGKFNNDKTPKGSGYWLASTGIWTDTYRVRYGLFVASYGIGFNTMYTSNAGTATSNSSQGIRPIVTLKSGVKLTDSQKTKNGCKIWNM